MVRRAWHFGQSFGLRSVAIAAESSRLSSYAKAQRFGHALAATIQHVLGRARAAGHRVADAVTARVAKMRGRVPAVVAGLTDASVGVARPSIDALADAHGAAGKS